MLFLTLVRHKTLNTIKSRHDEQNNQALLGRLKNIAVIGGNKKAPPVKAIEIAKGGSAELPERRLTSEKLNRLVTYYQSDPLNWNASVLGRIYRVPEHYCNIVVNYVAPMIFYQSRTYDEPVQITPQRVVIDVARLQSDDKSDCNYLVTYKKIVFPKRSEKLPAKALQDI